MDIVERGGGEGDSLVGNTNTVGRVSPPITFLFYFYLL